MNILLLNPPTNDNRAFIREGRCNQEKGFWGTLWPPVTLANAGALLEESGHRVTIMDCAALGTTRKELLAMIRRSNHALIVWAAATPSINSDLALANEIKAIAPRVKTGVFGTHVTALADRCLKDTPKLDFIIRNEPEASLCALVDALVQATGLEVVLGISYRGEKDEICHNRARPFIADLDEMPLPAWHLLDLERYRLPMTGEKFLILAPVRGCPYRCIFCTAQTYYGRKIRKKSIGRIISEIEQGVSNFDVRQFFIWADTFTADREYVLKFSGQILKEKLDIGWTCNSRVDTVDEQLVNTMRQAGCWMISFGIESGDQAVLDECSKKTTIEQCRRAVAIAKAAGIKTAAHFVLGLPGETPQTLAKTVELALELNPEIAQFYCAVPFPGSPLYDLADKKGWISGSEFDDFRQDNASMNMPGLPPALVNQYRRSAFRRFYLKPRRIVEMSKFIRSDGLGNAIKEGFQFIRWMRPPV